MDAQELQALLDALEQRVRDYVDARTKEHQHGQDAQNVQLPAIFGLFEVVSTAPTAAPKNLFDQIKIYVNGTTYRLYCYDYKGHAWHYATLT